MNQIYVPKQWSLGREGNDAFFPIASELVSNLIAKQKPEEAFSSFLIRADQTLILYPIKNRIDRERFEELLWGFISRLAIEIDLSLSKIESLLKKPDAHRIIYSI